MQLPGSPATTYVGLDGFRATWRDWLAPWASYRTEIEELIDVGLGSSCSPATMAGARRARPRWSRETPPCGPSATDGSFAPSSMPTAPKGWHPSESDRTRGAWSTSGPTHQDAAVEVEIVASEGLQFCPTQARIERGRPKGLFVGCQSVDQCTRLSRRNNFDLGLRFRPSRQLRPTRVRAQSAQAVQLQL
jgi:hypothetical protein